MAAQRNLPGFNYPKAHGGELSRGKRKTARPIATKRPMHIVFRSSFARGPFSFLLPKNRRIIEALLSKLGRAFGVKIYQIGNAGNHIHLLVRAKTRWGFQIFLRVFAGLVARRITGAKKGKPFGKKFWDLLVWTRVLEWGKDFAAARKYVLQNEWEGRGLIAYQARGKGAKKARAG